MRPPRGVARICPNICPSGRKALGDSLCFRECREERQYSAIGPIRLALGEGNCQRSPGVNGLLQYRCGDGTRTVRRREAPVISFKNRMARHVDDHNFQTTHLPGHSLYQAAVSVKEEERRLDGGTTRRSRIWRGSEHMDGRLGLWCWAWVYPITSRDAPEVPSPYRAPIGFGEHPPFC